MYMNKNHEELKTQQNTTTRVIFVIRYPAHNLAPVTTQAHCCGANPWPYELSSSLECVFVTKPVQHSHTCCGHSLFWGSQHSAVYVAGGNANKSPLCSWNSPQPSPCSSVKEPSRSAQLFPLTNQDWAHTITMELEMKWVFLFALLRGKLLRTMDMGSKVHDWDKQWICVTVSWASHPCVCMCSGWNANDGGQETHGAAWGLPETLLCNFRIHLQWLCVELALPGYRKGAGVDLWHKL